MLKRWYIICLVLWAVFILPGLVLAIFWDWQSALYGFFVHLSNDDPIDLIGDILSKFVVLFPLIALYFGINKKDE